MKTYKILRTSTTVPVYYTIGNDLEEAVTIMNHIAKRLANAEVCYYLDEFDGTEHLRTLMTLKLSEGLTSHYKDVVI